MLEIQALWAAHKFTGTYSDAKEHANNFQKYKQSSKRMWVTEKQDITTLFGNVQTKLRTYGLREYLPPAGLSLAVSLSLPDVVQLLTRLQDLEAAWTALLASETRRFKSINAQIREYVVLLELAGIPPLNSCDLESKRIFVRSLLMKRTSLNDACELCLQSWLL